MNLRVALVVFLLAAGCARNPPPAQPNVALRAMGQSVTAEDAPSDESIGVEVRRRIDAQGPGDMAGVIIEVDDGAVTLRGVAPSQAAAWRAQSAAQSVKGVKLVRNQVIIGNRGPVP